jgi:HSP20 family protein
LNKNLATDANIHAPVNITEAKEFYKLELAVPGRNKEDFKINIDRNLLTVSFEKKEEVKEENETFVRNEFSFNSFKRTFTLNEKVDAERISAKYENGILVLNLPKKEELIQAPKEVQIQ